jgi:hypothetical protein
MRADLLQQGRLACGVLATAAALMGCISDDAAAAARVASAPTPEATGAADRCAFGAFVQEDDPAGLNVRAAPSPAGRILGTLPPSVSTADSPDFKVRIELDVVGQKDGWFHIEHARDNEQLTGKAARKVVAGDGWVSGHKLTVKSQATQGHAAPDAHSPTVLSLGDADGFDGDALVGASHLVGCHGIWALIELDTARLPADVRAQLKVAAGGPAGSTTAHPRAWVDRVCGVQETTCEGLGAK